MSVSIIVGKRRIEHAKIDRKQRSVLSANPPSFSEPRFHSLPRNVLKIPEAVHELTGDEIHVAIAVEVAVHRRMATPWTAQNGSFIPFAYNGDRFFPFRLAQCAGITGKIHIRLDLSVCPYARSIIAYRTRRADLSVMCPIRK